MRNELRIFVLLVAGLMAASALGQTTAPAAAPPILQGATLPMYPPIAKAAHLTGKVVGKQLYSNGGNLGDVHWGDIFSADFIVFWIQPNPERFAGAQRDLRRYSPLH